MTFFSIFTIAALVVIAVLIVLLFAFFLYSIWTDKGESLGDRIETTSFTVIAFGIIFVLSAVFVEAAMR